MTEVSVNDDFAIFNLVCYGIDGYTINHGDIPGKLASCGNITPTNLDSALQKADILLLVNHHAFKGIDRGLLKEKAVIDTRGEWR